MRFNCGITLLLFSLYLFQIILCQKSPGRCEPDRYDGTSREEDYSSPSNIFFNVLVKRFGIECVLNGGVKGVRGDIVDAIMSAENTTEVCIRNIMRNAQRDIQASRKSDQNRYDSASEFDRQKLQIEINCQHLIKGLECLHPLENLFNKCKQVEGLALFALAKKLCHNNGSQILEFMKLDGGSCFAVGPRPNPPTFQNCLNKNFNSKVNDTEIEPYILKNSCKAASDFKDCVVETLGQCKKSVPRKIVDKFLTRLKVESPEANKCFFRNSYTKQEQKKTEEKKEKGVGGFIKKGLRKVSGRPKSSW